jgi:hypothetical protein
VARRTAGYLRRQQPPAPPFRAWGLTMSLFALGLAWIGAWVSAGIVVCVLVFYLLAVRRTRCRVQAATHGGPCRWRVRGFLGTCEWHRGMKRGLPRLVPGGWGAPPKLMWPRDDLESTTMPPEHKPQVTARGAEMIAPDAPRPERDWVPLSIEIGGLLVALIALMYDVTTG